MYAGLEVNAYLSDSIIIWLISVKCEPNSTQKKLNLMVQNKKSWSKIKTVILCARIWPLDLFGCSKLNKIAMNFMLCEFCACQNIIFCEGKEITFYRTNAALMYIRERDPNLGPTAWSKIIDIVLWGRVLSVIYIFLSSRFAKTKNVLYNSRKINQILEYSLN